MKNLKKKRNESDAAFIKRLQADRKYYAKQAEECQEGLFELYDFCEGFARKLCELLQNSHRVMAEQAVACFKDDVFETYHDEFREKIIGELV